MTRPDSTPLLASIHVPTLIVVGDEDTVTPPSAAAEMHRAIAGSELVDSATRVTCRTSNSPRRSTPRSPRFLDHRV